MNTFEFSISGDKEIMRMFEELPGRTQERVLKPIMRDASNTIAAAIKAETPVETGLMKLAVGASKLKEYSGGKLFITAGVRRGFDRAVTVGRRGKPKYRSASYTAKNPAERMRKPTKYLHLVAGGHRIVNAAGQVTGQTKPDPFVDRAFDNVAASVADSIVKQAEPRIMAEAQALLK